KAIIGYVPEEPHLYSYLTGPEYLRLVGRLRGLADAPLNDKIDRFLQLLDIYDDRYQTLSSYSKGMRQKVLIAAAVLHNPRIVGHDSVANLRATLQLPSLDAVFAALVVEENVEERSRELVAAMQS